MFCAPMFFGGKWGRSITDCSTVPQIWFECVARGGGGGHSTLWCRVQWPIGYEHSWGLSAPASHLGRLLGFNGLSHHYMLTKEGAAFFCPTSPIPEISLCNRFNWRKIQQLPSHPTCEMTVCLQLSMNMELRLSVPNNAHTHSEPHISVVMAAPLTGAHPTSAPWYTNTPWYTNHGVIYCKGSVGQGQGCAQGSRRSNVQHRNDRYIATSHLMNWLWLDTSWPCLSFFKSHTNVNTETWCRRSF